MKNVDLGIFQQSELKESADLSNITTLFTNNADLLTNVEKEDLQRVVAGKKTHKTIWKLSYRTAVDHEIVVKRINTDVLQEYKELKRILSAKFRTLEDSRAVQQQEEQQQEAQESEALSERLSQQQIQVPVLAPVLPESVPASGIADEGSLLNEQHHIMMEVEKEVGDEKLVRMQNDMHEMKNEMQILHQHYNNTLQEQLRNNVNSTSEKFYPFVERPEQFTEVQFTKWYKHSFYDDKLKCWRIFSVNKKKPSIEVPTIQYSVWNYFEKNQIKNDVPIYLNEQAWQVTMVWFCNFHCQFLNDVYQVNNYNEFKKNDLAKDSLITCIKRINRNCKNAENKKINAYKRILDAFLEDLE